VLTRGDVSGRENTGLQEKEDGKYRDVLTRGAEKREKKKRADALPAQAAIRRQSSTGPTELGCSRRPRAGKKISRWTLHSKQTNSASLPGPQQVLEGRQGDFAAV
jgi:hypothetical protein